MIRYFKKAIPLSILATGIIVTASMADTFTLRVGSGHPSKPTAYVTNMEKVLVPNIKKRVKAETDHKVRIIEAYAGKIAKVHETLEAVEKGLLDIGSYCVCFETAKLLPWNFDYFVPFTTTNLETNWAVKHKILKQFPTLTKMLEDKYNQKFIAMQGFDDYGIGTVKQWQKASELKGVKVIAAGPNLPWVSLFGSIPGLVLVKDGEGNVFMPSMSIDNIGTVSVTKGYQILVEQASVFQKTGKKIRGTDLSLSLSAGWHLIPYWSDLSNTPAAALSAINSDVIILKDEEGQIYMPSFGIDNITSLLRGKSYLILLDASVELSYPN